MPDHFGAANRNDSGENHRVEDHRDVSSEGHGVCCRSGRLYRERTQHSVRRQLRSPGSTAPMARLTQTRSRQASRRSCARGPRRHQLACSGHRVGAAKRRAGRGKHPSAHPMVPYSWRRASRAFGQHRYRSWGAGEGRNPDWEGNDAGSERSSRALLGHRTTIDGHGHGHWEVGHMVGGNGTEAPPNHGLTGVRLIEVATLIDEEQPARVAAGRTRSEHD